METNSFVNVNLERLFIICIRKYLNREGILIEIKKIEKRNVRNVQNIVHAIREKATRRKNCTVDIPMFPRITFIIRAR